MRMLRDAVVLIVFARNVLLIVVVDAVSFGLEILTGPSTFDEGGGCCNVVAVEGLRARVGPDEVETASPSGLLVDIASSSSSTGGIAAGIARHRDALVVASRRHLRW